MERLTMKTGVYQNGQYEIIAGMKCGVELKDIFDRLAAYEDTGLKPEEIKSLITEWDANLKTLNAYRSRFSSVIAPMRYGYWMDSSNGWTCSECGYRKMTDIHVSLGYNYCPKCGAKMDEEVPVRGKI